ncbi:phosphoribosyl c-AMP cyclohydrolase [Parvularcula bermudensis HTCC2503]|uniref:Phosphoribosyl-AMP cyclohydrolase n=1 Tax=Parvularcula bermudensis (strain ATCC BAA-594 / HTCC2503 / KCTC 12087) TaxID=314260 RepID=E0TBN2_PARBH|nr:phosphoribosyl-AMP cyclohydrolase [Parvularcula bermudensis]ADM08407.1 phosphoribosyl c-AMP cyclohydrolase [Parvularcula bermudensis HTCC2503]
MTATAIDETDRFSPRFDDRGLIPAIAVEATTGQVLMLAYMTAEAIERTLTTGEVHYWSRSRGELWHKGATSGHTQKLVEMRVDCDQDTVLVRVEQSGPACHTGRPDCFYRKVEGPPTAPSLSFDANAPSPCRQTDRS